MIFDAYICCSKTVHSIWDVLCLAQRPPARSTNGAAVPKPWPVAEGCGALGRLESVRFANTCSHAAMQPCIPFIVFDSSSWWFGYASFGVPVAVQKPICNPETCHSLACKHSIMLPESSRGDQIRPQCKKHNKGQHDIDIIERGKMRLKSREPCSDSVHWTILGPNRTVTSWGNCFRLWPAYPNIQALEDSTAQIDGIDIVMPGLSSFHALTCRLAICGWMKIKRCASPAWNNSSCSSIPHLRFWKYSMVQRWTKLLNGSD